MWQSQECVFVGEKSAESCCSVHLNIQKPTHTDTHTDTLRKLFYHMWIKGNRTEATFPREELTLSCPSRNWKQHSTRTERESPCRFYLPPLPSAFSSQDLKVGPHAQHCTLFPGEHFSFPHYLHEKRWPPCLGKRPEGLRAKSVWACAQVARKGLVVTAGCVLAWWLVVGGHQASASQGPADTNPGIQEQLDPSSSLTSLHLLLLPLTLVLRNAGWTFLQEMKRSSVQKAREGLVSPFILSLSSLPSTGRRERGKESDKLSPSFWSVGG